MEQVTALAERIKVLKQVAFSMQEGAIHTRLFTEVDKILALPDDLTRASVGEREAVTRQVREYEQTFDQLGYSLLKQIMPTTGVSPIFRVVQAAEAFGARLKQHVGQQLRVGQDSLELSHHHCHVLTRYSLSIGTPPVTADIGQLISRTVFGRPLDELLGYADFLGCDPVDLEQLLRLLQTLVSSSLHYCTAAEEAEFLRDATELINFEGGRLLNRVVITESPERVVGLIQDHLFDKFGTGDAPPVVLVPGVDSLGPDLVARMQAAPNGIFVARVTRLPHRLFLPGGDTEPWRSVLGRLVLIDCSERALQSNTTIVYTLFPHVARTLRNIQTSLAGRPANTQLQLRRILERFSAKTLTGIRQAVERRMAFLNGQGLLDGTVEQLRAEDWRRHTLLDYLALAKLRRLLTFLETVAGGDTAARKQLGRALAGDVGQGWLRYFHRGLPPERYAAAVVPGGGRGTLTLMGEYHRQRVLDAVGRFCEQHLEDYRLRLAELKQGLQIPNTSTDEIQAAIKQSQLRTLSPSQWQNGDRAAGLTEYLARTLVYRLADGASRGTRKTRHQLDRAAFGNVTGGAAAFFKQAFSRAGLSALHGRLEDLVGQRVGQYDRRVRDALAPVQDWFHSVQRAIDEFKGELDPVAISEIEAVLELVEQGNFHPTLILPELAWSYGDVFPDKHFPPGCIIRVPHNAQHELDPLALMTRLEELRYLFRNFPELFALYCETMLLVVNSPHNPTGVHYRRETVLRLLKIASEYGITVLEDNSYHKLVFSWQRAREGHDSVAQIYEKYRAHFTRPVRLLTAGATTKGLQGAGDRTGVLCSADAEAVAYARGKASQPHLLSLFLTRAKLEQGLEVKRICAALERVAAAVVDPTDAPRPWDDVRALLEQLLPGVHQDQFPVAVFETLLAGYEELLRVKQRGASRLHLSECLSNVVASLKALRLEYRLRQDVEQRVQQVDAAVQRTLPGVETIAPHGAFYYCFRICDADDDRGVQQFLCALSQHRKVDLTYAGSGFVRISLGGMLEGDAASYQRLGQVVQTYLQVMQRYWQRFCEVDRDPRRLYELLAEGGLEAALTDLAPLLGLHPAGEAAPVGLIIAPGERGTVYCIEEGRSVADKLYVESAGCDSVEAMLRSRPFGVVYRRLLRRVYRDNPSLSEMPFGQLENQFGPISCRHAYHDRQLIDDDFRRVITLLYQQWHSQSTIRVLASTLAAERPSEKAAALHGRNGKINELVNELMYAFEVPQQVIDGSSSFDLGVELLRDVRPAPALPDYLRRVVQRCAFAGATVPLSPAPTYVTGATRRIADYRYGFIRRDADAAGGEGEGSSAASPGLDYFCQRLTLFAEQMDPSHYLGKAVQVGPFKILLLVHKSCLHLISDELRLFPQIDSVRRKESLDELDWDAVLHFGLPAKVMGHSYKTGYVIDAKQGGAPLPTAWVAREDATDYVGFLKKSLLTLHNELVKAMGGMPVHGAMITVTFVNGLRKTLVLSADSGTGKSETIAALMEQAASGLGTGAELQQIDILAGDMLSLWRGEDQQIYAFGTETGDFMRLTDITERWKVRFGDLLKRGSYSNLDHPKNPRVTIPGICDARRVLSPTRVNGFFYINNYEAPRGSAVELDDDPHRVLKDVLVRGLRKNKGTSGDQPNLRAGLAFAGRSDLVTRYQHTIDELLQWRSVELDGGPRTCLAYRDGAGDVYAARELVSAAMVGQTVTDDAGQARTVREVEHDLMQNVFWLQMGGRARVPLDRTVYDQLYEPLVSTFCGNPFVNPAGMGPTLVRFADTMRQARVHTGVIRTQLARPGREFSGPDRAAGDVTTFLLQDEEVNARFQRNKDKVSGAMQSYFGGVLPAGSNLPLELEGYNLLLLEEYESTHVRFFDGDDAPFTVRTPFYSYQEPMQRGSFVPALLLPQIRVVLEDICGNPDHQLDLDELDLDLSVYQQIHHWGDMQELLYQVLLVNGVISLGSSRTEVARFPGEVRKAWHVAQGMARARAEVAGAS